MIFLFSHCWPNFKYSTMLFLLFSSFFLSFFKKEYIFKQTRPHCNMTWESQGKVFTFMQICSCKGNCSGVQWWWKQKYSNQVLKETVDRLEYITASGKRKATDWMQPSCFLREPHIHIADLTSTSDLGLLFNSLL